MGTNWKEVREQEILIRGQSPEAHTTGSNNKNILLSLQRTTEASANSHVCMQQPYELFYRLSPVTHTPLIRSPSGSSSPSQTQLPSSLSSYKRWLSPVEAVGIRRWRRRWCVHDVWCVLMSDAVWWLMLGEAYSNGETEVRETITTVEEEGTGKRKWEVRCCLLQL